MGLIGSDTRLLDVTWSKLPVERPVSRISRPVVLLSLVRAPAQPPQHANFGSRSHTPSSRCLRFERRVAATPARLAPVLPARLWTDQTCTGKLASASPIEPRIRLPPWVYDGEPAVRGPAPGTRFPGPEPGACGPVPRSPRPPPFAPPTPQTVARRCSPASQLLWRSLTSPVRASSATAPRLPDADQTAQGPVVGL